MVLCIMQTVLRLHIFFFKDQVIDGILNMIFIFETYEVTKFYILLEIFCYFLDR